MESNDVAAGADLRAWRDRFGIDDAVVAAVLSVSRELYGRIECGEIEPAPELAMRIHVVTGGVVPASTWPTVRGRLLEGGLRLDAIATRRLDGRFGVTLFLGAEAFGCVPPDEANAFAHKLLRAAMLADCQALPMLALAPE